MPFGMTKKTLGYLWRILKFLEDNPSGTYQANLARSLNLHPEHISNLVERYLQDFVNVEMVGGHFLKMIKLKPGMEEKTIADVKRYINTRRALRGLSPISV